MMPVKRPLTYRSPKCLMVQSSRVRVTVTVAIPTKAMVASDHVRMDNETLVSYGRPNKTFWKVRSLMILRLAPESISIHNGIPSTRNEITFGGG
uniref:Uncharacterized protein n=1 Tax=Trichuris muris TaxID=70415 RepID=A0A5S6R1T4_TRIMR